MNHLYKVFLGALSSLACALLQALGGWDAALSLMFLAMGLDLLTGCLVSLHHKSDKTPGGGFLSRAFLKGLTRKMMMLIMVILAVALDGLMHTELSRLCVIGFYFSNEALSIIENAALLGVPFPKTLLKALERLRDEKGGETGQETEKR